MAWIIVVRSIAEGITLVAGALTTLTAAIAGAYQLGKSMGLWGRRRRR